MRIYNHSSVDIHFAQIYSSRVDVPVGTNAIAYSAFDFTDGHFGRVYQALPQKGLVECVAVVWTEDSQVITSFPIKIEIDRLRMNPPVFSVIVRDIESIPREGG